MKLLFVFMILCFDTLNIQACSLPKCKPGTQHCIVGSVGADCRGVLGCLKSCPPGSNPIGPLVPNQCNGTQVQSPFDVCNSCQCEDGLVTRTCTEIGCSRGKKKEGDLCGDVVNNCEGGLTCVWDGQDNGVGICKSTQGSQAKIKISGSDGYQYPNVTITFSNGIIADVIITGETDTFTGETEEGQLCFLKGVVAGQLGSEVKLIGCLPEEDRHEEDQMTIILKAGSDSGWYSAYYATPQDDFITVKKIRNKKNVSVIRVDVPNNSKPSVTPPPPPPPPPPFTFSD